MAEGVKAVELWQVPKSRICWTCPTCSKFERFQDVCCEKVAFHIDFWFKPPKAVKRIGCAQSQQRKTDDLHIACLHEHGLHEGMGGCHGEV